MQRELTTQDLTGLAGTSKMTTSWALNQNPPFPLGSPTCLFGFCKNMASVNYYTRTFLPDGMPHHRRLPHLIGPDHPHPMRCNERYRHFT